jgi:hypothetical protein
MRPVTVSRTGVGVSSVVAVDYMQNSPAVGIAAVVSGTVTYDIQHTYSDVLDSTVTPVWFIAPELAAKTVSADGVYVGPIRGLRINVSAGTGSVTLTVLQGDPR